MKYLKVFESNDNELYYTLLDIIQYHLDDLNITGVPDYLEDDVESYLESSGEHWGFHKKKYPTGSGYLASSGKVNFDVNCLVIWNLTGDRCKRLTQLIEGETDRIEESGIGHLHIKVEEIDSNVFDIHLKLRTPKEHQKEKEELKRKSEVQKEKEELKRKSEVEQAKNTLTNFTSVIDKLTDKDRGMALLLIEQLNEISKKVQ